MKTEKSFPCILGLIIAIFIIVTVQPVSAGDGVTRYWGVFVGISDYQTVSDLDFCADDATSIYNLFLQDSRWDASRMTLLRNSQAPRMAVENAITAMASSSDDDDICLFFFSGHGGQAYKDFVPSDESDGKDEYIVCWDSNNSDYTGDFIDDDMGETLGQISGTTVVMLDACFSGGHIKATSSKAASGKIQTSRNIKFIIKPFEQHAGITRKGDGFASDLVDRVTALKDANDQSDIIVLTASDDNEESFEGPEFRHGTFTYFLLLGLKSNDVNSNGYVSAEESFAYLEPVLREYENSTVTPQQYDGTSGETDLLQPTAERLVFVGSGDFHWIYPFNTYYQKQRAEYIYTHSQLGQGGDIKALKIFVEEKPLMPLKNCTIRMKHTTDSEYGSSPQWTSSGWTTVYAGTKTIDDIGPVPFILSTPFHYDGIRNLIIDFSFSNSSYENEGFFYGSFSDTYSMIYHSRDDDAYGEPTTWAGTSPQPTRDENPPDAGSYLDLELEFYTINTSQGSNAMPWIPLLLLSESGKPVLTKWIGPAGFGTFEFITDNDLTEIKQLKFIFSNFSCGGVTKNGTLTSSLSIPISNKQFSHTVTFSPDFKMTIAGEFNVSGEFASGTWEALSYGMTCRGIWEASPL
jgi:hypothetical protein